MSLNVPPMLDLGGFIEKDEDIISLITLSSCSVWSVMEKRKQRVTSEPRQKHRMFFLM